MRLRTKLAALAAAALVVAAAPVIAQQRLQSGGTTSTFGRRGLRGGFMPDPFVAPLATGGNIDASTLRLGADCRGFVTRQPDYIIDYDAPASFVRFFFRGT